MADEPAADSAKTLGQVPATTGADTKAGDAESRLPGFFKLGRGFFGTGATPGADPALKRDRWFFYAAQGALVVAIVGFGWAVGGHIYAGHQSSDRSVAEAAIRAKAEADQVELRKTTMAMASDIKSLKGALDALKAAGNHTPTQDEIHGLERNVEALKGKLDVAKTETTAALAQLGGKVDKAQADPAGKLREMSERLERIEKQTSAPLTTASIPTPAVTVAPTPLPLPRAKTPAAAPPEAEVKKPQPQLINGWVVRDVYEGVAVVEGPRGPLEVVPGETIPGAGIVKSIERRGAGWVVITSRGVVDYARN